MNVVAYFCIKLQQLVFVRSVGYCIFYNRVYTWTTEMANWCSLFHYLLFPAITVCLSSRFNL